MTEATLRVYLARGETAPVRAIRHKGHIVKVLFLAALARPRFDSNGCTFDGKIGCWPFVEKRVARRASANRPAGTRETKCVNVTAKEYMKIVRNKVIPSIIAKFPQEQGLHGRRTVVRLQHDNATSHFKWFDPEWIDTWFEHRLDWDFQLKEQPPNSPDCNILDLGFFRALQSLQWQQGAAKSIDQLIANVQTAWSQYDPVKINRVFLTHQSCMDCILSCGGSNEYKVPHMGKESLERQNRLPKTLIVSSEAFSRYDG